MMVEGKEPSILELKQRIDSIPDVLEVPCWDKTIKIDGAMIRSLDRFLYLTGCRISEVVTRSRKNSKSVGTEASLNFTTFEKEDVAIWTLTTLKRANAKKRNIALPLRDPWVRKLALEWHKVERKSPYHFTRDYAYNANRVVFDGFIYIVEDQMIKRRDGSIIYEKEEHPKPSSDHGLRHFRARELTVDYGFNDNELMTFFGWSPVSFGKNTYMQRYQNLRWQDYFPKLLSRQIP